MDEKLLLLSSDGKTTDILKEDMPIRDYEGYILPILYLTGNLAGMTKDNAVTVNYIFKERSGTCTLKWQGSSSLGLSKKNFTIKFDNAFEIVSGWGVQNKYVLKANFVDSTHARNIVCAKLWGQIVKSRTPANATLNALPNGGAIDGFPIILSINGKFAGIYTWNIPKDGWMFGMSGTSQQQAIVCAEQNNNGAVAFKGLATLTEDTNGQLDFDLEYSSDDKSDWVVTSLNRLLAAVKDSDGTNITYGITPYIDWESAIDYYIHTVLTANYDGVYRNYLLATYDGVKWFFTGYDMDVVLGLRAMGRYFYAANTSVEFKTVAGQHKLFELIWKYMRPQLRARYNELRAAAMSVENVANLFTDFIAEIPLPIYVDDVRLWNTIPSNSANNLSHIITYYDLRCRNADEWIKNTSGETALPEQVNPDAQKYTNQVPISKDTDGSIFNGKGYVTATRLSSSGATKTANYASTTGYIPATSGAVIRIAGENAGLNWLDTGKASACYVCTYKADFSFIGAVNNGGAYGGGTVGGDSKVATVTLPNNSEIAYVRVSASHNDKDATYNLVNPATDGPGAYLIVTVNEEITE